MMEIILSFHAKIFNVLLDEKLNRLTFIFQIVTEMMFTFGVKYTNGIFTQTQLKRCDYSLFHLFLPTYSVNCTNVLNSTMCMYRCMHRMSGNHPCFRVRDVRA